MSQPLTIRFATDHSAAKSGMQDLAASVVSNMVKVSDALNTGVQANGGYAATFKMLAANVGKDAANVANAGLTTAANSNLSMVATAGAMGKAAAETKTASVAMTGAMAVASAQASFAFNLIRNEASQTLKMLASSPIAIGAIGGVVGAIAGLVFVKSAVGQANEQIERFIKLGDDAASVGVGVEFWQRFLDGAKKAKLEIADVEQMLKHAGKEVAPRFDEEDPIKKRLGDLFESGYLGDYQSKGLSDYRKAGNNEDRIRATITAMQELRDLGDHLAMGDLGDRLWGPGTAERIRAGKVDIDAIAAALDRQRDDLITQEQVEKAAEFRDRLEAAWKTIDEALHVSIAMQDAGRGILDVWENIVTTAAKAAVAFGNIGLKIDEAAKSSEDLLAKLGQLAGAGAVNDWLYGKRTLYDKPIGPELPAGYTPPSSQGKEQTVPLPPRRPLSVVLDQQKDQTQRGGGGGAKESFDAVETYINGLEKTAAAAKAEADAFGKSNAEKAQAIALAKLKETADQQGIAVTDDQTNKVKAAATATATYKDKLADLGQAQNKAAETAKYFGNAISDSFADAILEGKSFQNILLDLEKMLAKAALKAAFTGEGPLASLFGTATSASAGSGAVGGLTGMFTSMFRANGGPVSAGRAYTVGEMGQELFVPDQDGRMVPINRNGGGFGGGGGGVQIIDQRTMASPAPVTRQGSNGNTQIILRDAEGAMYQRASRGQGPFAGAIGGAATRRG